MSILIEHYAGAFPTWLSPLQAVVIPIADRHNDYALQVAEQLRHAAIPGFMGGIRAEADLAREGMQKKIRNAQIRKVPYMLVIGDTEMDSQQVSVRLRSGLDLKAMPIEALTERIVGEISRRRDTV